MVSEVKVNSFLYVSAIMISLFITNFSYPLRIRGRHSRLVQFYQTIRSSFEGTIFNIEVDHEIDESKFGRRNRIRGRCRWSLAWVVGGVERVG